MADTVRVTLELPASTLLRVTEIGRPVLNMLEHHVGQLFRAEKIVCQRDGWTLVRPEGWEESGGTWVKFEVVKETSGG
jgi:hypothetical protein